MTSHLHPSGATMSAASGDARILANLEGRIPAVATSFGYRLSLVVTSGIMILLPIIYLALIGAAIYGMWAYVTFLPFQFDVDGGSRGKQVVGAFIWWSIPLVVGAMLVLFLIKPIFAPRSREVKPLALDRRREPLLFAFVERLCQVLGAPSPAAIYLDNEVNASVRLVPGRGRELALTVGAPLVAGLSLAQLAGVLAHEFGHFKQHAGLRLSFFVRRMNGWLARVAYERDAIDAWLVRESKDAENGWLSSLILHLCRGAVWLTRRVLAGLVWVAHAVSSFQLRHMELDADRYEARLVGYPVFASTMEEMALLGVAHSQALSGLEECWNDGRLPDSLPQLTLLNRHSLDDELVAIVQGATAEQRTGLFDSHPAPADRLASARREGDTALFATSEPAAVLFTDFEALGRLVTRAHYCTVLGEAVRPEHLMTVERTAAQLEQSSSERQALGEYFGGGLSSLRPLAMGAISAGSTVTEVDVARHLAVGAAAELEAGLEAYGEAYNTFVSTLQGEAILELRLPLDAKELGLPARDLPSVLKVQEEATVRLESLDASLRPLEQQQGRRMSCALGFLSEPEIAESVDADGGLRREVPELLELTVLMGSLFKAGRQLNADRAVMAALGSKLEDHKELEDLDQALAQVAGRIMSQLDFFRQTLSGVAYPFEHAVPLGPLRGDTEAMPLSYYVVVLPDDPSNAGELFEASGSTLEQFYDVYFRAAGRLAAIAQTLEEAVGLGPGG